MDYVPEFHRIQLWNIESGAKVRAIIGSVFAVFSPDGRTIATASGRHHHEVALVEPWTPLRDIIKFKVCGHKQRLCCASWSLEGSKLASGSRDGTCKVWDSSTGALLRTIRAQYSVLSVVWARAGHTGRDGVRNGAPPAARSGVAAA